jgi:hypothetical protein
MLEADAALTAADVDALARATEGLSCADLIALCRAAAAAPAAEAAAAAPRSARRRGGAAAAPLRPVEMRDFDAPLARVARGGGAGSGGGAARCEALAALARELTGAAPAAGGR